MSEIVKNSCGLDTHKLFFPLLSPVYLMKKQLLDGDNEGILALKNWIILAKYDIVACESVSDFWFSICD